MAETLTNLQTDVRFWTDQDNLTITAGTNLRMFNQVYQGLFTPDYKMFGVRVGRRWPEATREDTSVTMVVGQEQYTFPTSPVFKEPFFIEGLNTNQNNLPYIIQPATNMALWSRYEDLNNAQPILYRLLDVAGTVKLALRPNPDQTDTVRITGLIEVTELTGGSDSTIFRNKNADRALAMLVAAMFQAKFGDVERAQQLARQANALLPREDRSPRLSASPHIMPWPL